MTNWGVLGAGVIASKFALDLGRSDSGRLIRVASRDPARAAAFAARYGVDKAIESAEALVADPAVDAVYVATPNALHAPHALMAIEAGKPVLVEKPFALSADEAEAVVAAARRKGVFCMEAMWTRHLPLYGALREEIQGGALGKPTLLRAEMGFPIARGAGGAPAALLDLGVYGVSMAHWLFGPPTSVSAAARLAEGGDLDATATLRHAGGEISVILASHGAELANTLEIVGDRGRASVDAPFLQASRARLTAFAAHRPAQQTPESGLKAALKRTPLWPIARAAARRALGKDGRILSRPFVGDGYQFEAEEVARRLAAGALESPVTPLDDSVAVMRTLDQIREAWADA